jgi:hypothetical protein
MPYLRRIMIRYMLLLKLVKEILRQMLLSLRLWWCPKLNIVHLLPTSGITHLRRRIKLRLAFTRGTQFHCQRILLDRVVPTFHHLISRAGIVINLVTGPRIAHILPSRILRETSVRGVFTTILWRKFLLVKWSLLVSFLLMIIPQLCYLIQVLHIPL